MKVFTHITDASFDGSLAFLRKMKAEGREVFVFASSLTKESNRKKIVDLGFSLILEENPYARMAAEEEQSIFVISFENFDVPKGEGIFCSGPSVYNLEDITLPISNIHQRVNVAKLLESNLIDKQGSLLSTDYVAAPAEFWALMNGVHKKWVDEFFVSSSPVTYDLLFNFCVAFYNKPLTIGVKDV